MITASPVWCSGFSFVCLAAERWVRSPLRSSQAVLCCAVVDNGEEILMARLGRFLTITTKNGGQQRLRALM